MSLPATLAIALVLVLVLAGCGSVSVTPSRTGFKAASRPAGCTIEFLHHAPQRGYDELGEMFSYFASVVEPQDVLREKACELGADAVIVTWDSLISHGRGPDHKLVAGIAIKYRGTTSAPAHCG